MEIGNITITKREVLVCVAITLILTGLGFIISTKIQNAISEKNELYFKALKINNDEEKFRYAIRTNMGNAFVEGEVEAVNGVHLDEIENDYFYIKKVKEKYIKHTRQVEHTRTVGNETEVYYTTEEYYTWDYAGKEEYHTEKFKFLNVEFYYGTINFHNTTYLTTIQIDSSTRYKYYVIPFEFDGTLFTEIKDNTISNNCFYYNQSIEEIIRGKEKDLYQANGIFWGLWVFGILALNVIYVCFDNNYLED